MSEAEGPQCSRCGQACRDDAVRVTTSAGTAAALPADAQLCAHCARSLSRWFQRRGWKGKSSQVATNDEDSAGRSRRHSGKRREHRSRSPMARIFSVLRVVAAYVVVALVLFVIVYRFLGGLNMRPPE